jgi:hypothetical protein
MRSLLVLLAVGMLCLGNGCSVPEGQILEQWTLRTRDLAHPVRFPSHLNLELPNRIETYRLSAEIEVEPGLYGRDLDLAIPYLPAQVSLQVDGAPVPPAHGHSETAGRHIGPHRWAIPPDALRDGRVALELQVLHSWTQSAWLDVAPRLVPSGTVTPVMERNRILNDRGGWFGLIGLSQMGLAFLAIFLWDRQRRAYLWFAIQALAASYYPAHVLGLTTWLGPKLETLLLAHSSKVARSPASRVNTTWLGVRRS